jgi:glycosyltransferase involved in cell wall biosynthesis
MSLLTGRRVRVLHALSLDTIGGVEVLFAAFLQSSPAVLENHVLVMRGACHTSLADVIHKHAASIHYGTRWHGIKLPRLSRNLHLQHTLRTLCPDVVIMYNTLSNIELLNAAKRSGAACVYYERGAAWNDHDPDRTNSFLQRVDQVLCNSHAARRMLELRWNLVSHKVQVLHNPLRADLICLSVTTKQLPALRPLRLGIAGRLVPTKGFPLALHTLRLLLNRGIDCELYIAGEGPQKLNLAALSAHLGLQEKVRFCGLITAMEKFYQQIDILLYPSLREPLGNTCIEAGYFGCPVVGAAVDGIPEVIVEGVTGYCISPTLSTETYKHLGGGDIELLPKLVYHPAGDCLQAPLVVAPEHIAEKVLSLFQHPEVYMQMSAAAHAHIEQHFRWENYISAFTEQLPGMARH